MEKGIYFKLQLKKAFKIYPAILLITVITLSAIALSCFVMLSHDINSEKKQKVAIGIVGDIHDTYFGVGISAIQNMDSTRFSIDFIEMEEEDAINALKKREIGGYIHIPENFVKDIFSGKNTPAKYVTLNSPDGFGNIVMNEIAMSISDLITESQNGIYSMQNVSRRYDGGAGINSKTEDLNIMYVEYILNRESSYEQKILGVSDSLSMGGYYICGVILFFLLIWGISCDRLLGSKNVSLSRSLKISGVKVSRQMLCEYGAYLVVTLVTLVIIAVVFGTVCANADLGIGEIDGSNPLVCVGFLIMILPVIIMVTMMHTAFYELVSGVVSRILVLFLIAVGLGYISGCFYPNYFFPEAVQKIAAILPSGVGFAYIRRAMSGTMSALDFIYVILYTVGFAAIALAARNSRIAGDRI